MARRDGRDEGLEVLLSTLAALTGAILLLGLFLGRAACRTVQRAFTRYGANHPLLHGLAVLCGGALGVAVPLGVVAGMWSVALLIAGGGLAALVLGAWVVDARESRAMSRDAEALDLGTLLQDQRWWQDREM